MMARAYGQGHHDYNERKYRSTQTEEELDWGVDLWTTVNSAEPTAKQLTYILHLLETRKDADPGAVWAIDHMTRRQAGSIIHELLKL